MQPQKVDSVIGYLQTKRLIGSQAKPSPNKSKINRSMTSDDIASQPITPARQGETQLKSATHSREMQFFKKKQLDSDPYFQIQTSSDHQMAAKWSEDKKDAIKINTESNGAASRISKTSNKKSVISENQMPVSRNGDRFGSTRKGVDESSTPEPPNRKFKTNPDIYRLTIQQTMNKLLKVKDSLEQQISGLKKLLDETSATLENMDVEYQKFKEKIMLFVSRALDSAFKEYKKNLPNWAIYEAVEEKGLNKIAEINQAIEACQSEDMLREFGGKEQMQKLIDQGKVTALEVKDAKTDCLSQRPMISSEKIKKLQNILKQIGQF